MTMRWGIEVATGRYHQTTTANPFRLWLVKNLLSNEKNLIFPYGIILTDNCKFVNSKLHR